MVRHKHAGASVAIAIKDPQGPSTAFFHGKFHGEPRTSTGLRTVSREATAAAGVQVDPGGVHSKRRLEAKPAVALGRRVVEDLVE
jgi:hypothetical protein